MFNRWVERDGLLDTLDDLGIGSIVFTPLAQGLLTSKYLSGVPEDSRASQGKSLNPEWLSDGMRAKLHQLNEIAEARGQSLAQMALAWVLRGGRVTTALIGASRPEQISECAAATQNLAFSADELAAIDAIAEDADLNLWALSSEGV
jgi:L-glyceraldehyde 3-phosphate reductase